MSKKIMRVGLALALGLTFNVGLYASPSYDYAQVTRVEPDYRTVEVNYPKEVCYNENVYHRPRHRRRTSSTIPIIGAIIGGVIGNEIGHNSSSKRVGAVAGALLGGSVGRDIRDSDSQGYHRRSGYTTVERRCERRNSVRTEERIDGYRVTYRYLGKTYTAHTRHDPGSEIRVRVSVQAVEGY